MVEGIALVETKYGLLMTHRCVLRMFEWLAVDDHALTIVHERKPSSSGTSRQPVQHDRNETFGGRSTSCGTLGNASHRNNHLLGSVSSRQAKLPGASGCSFTRSLDPLSNTRTTTYPPSEMPLPGT
jgi:hypothetical protein